MTWGPGIEKLVSPLIPDQFPEFYEEYGPVFVDFARSYFAWFESGDVARATLSSRSVDSMPIGSRITVSGDSSSSTLVLGRAAGEVVCLCPASSLPAGSTVQEIISEKALTGLASQSSNSPLVIGSGTRFTSELSPGSYLSISGRWRRVSKVLSDYSLALEWQNDGDSLVLESISAAELGVPLSVVTSELVANPLGAARRLPEYSDVDYTLDSMLPAFKEEFLARFPDKMAASRRLFLKHALDLYRTKGNSQAVRLLFRVLYDADAEVYEPWRDILSASEGVWRRPAYVEVTASELIWDLPGYEVRSARGARAVVEGAYRKITGGQNAYVLALSSVRGNFKRGDALLCDEVSETPDGICTVVGSLSAISVVAGGSGFSRGDILSVEGVGFGARAKVIGVKEISGKLTFKIKRGGSGYTLSPDVISVVGGGGTGAIFSVGSISNTEILEIDLNLIGSFEDKVLDDEAAGFAVSFSGANGSFSAGEYVSSSCNVSALDVTIVSGSVQVGETLSGAFGNARVVESSEAQILVTDILGSLAEGETLVGNLTGATVTLDSEGEEWPTEANALVVSANSTVLSVNGCSSWSSDFWRVSSVAVVNAGSGYSNDDVISFSGVGVGGEARPLTNASGSILAVEISDGGAGYTSSPNVSVATSGGSGAVLSPESSLDGGYFFRGQQLVGSNSGVVASIESVSRETDWGMPAIGAENLDSLTEASLVPSQFEVGTISSLTAINPGENYFEAPAITVTETIVASQGLPDGLGGFKGNNALVVGITTVANGVITAVQVVDSGFSYQPGESLTLTHPSNESVVSGRAVVDLHGKSEGAWRDDRGSLNSGRLQDSYYYQQFSYDVLSELPIDTYERVVRDTVHPAGYALFGTVNSRDSRGCSVTLALESFSNT